MDQNTIKQLSDLFAAKTGMEESIKRVRDMIEMASSNANTWQVSINAVPSRGNAVGSFVTGNTDRMFVGSHGKAHNVGLNVGDECLQIVERGLVTAFNKIRDQISALGADPGPEEHATVPEKGEWICMIGNIGEGYRAIGPFATHAEAADFGAEDISNEDYVVFRLKKPTDA